ncbi:Com family DNA-binding transcriptional regulator [Desulfotomaculum defluvii]
MQDFRCAKCQKLLARYRDCQVLEIKCPRCGQTNKLHNMLVSQKLVKSTPVRRQVSNN